MLLTRPDTDKSDRIHIAQLTPRKENKCHALDCVNVTQQETRCQHTVQIYDISETQLTEIRHFKIIRSAAQTINKRLKAKSSPTCKF